MSVFIPTIDFANYDETDEASLNALGATVEPPRLGRDECRGTPAWPAPLRSANHGTPRE